MHGLINKAIQSFVVASYGVDRWLAVVDAAGLDSPDFEAMLIYEEAQTHAVLDALRRELNRDLSDILEDLGTYLVSHPEVERLRRLLRFSGVSYADFLHALDDLPGRVRLAVADLHLPALELREHAPGQYSLTCGPGLPGYGCVMMGVLRAMADDYGALALLDYQGQDRGTDVISVQLVDASFAEGRAFDLGAVSS